MTTKSNARLAAEHEAALIELIRRNAQDRAPPVRRPAVRYLRAIRAALRAFRAQL
jgi:hypothetical protein